MITAVSTIPAGFLAAQLLGQVPSLESFSSSERPRQIMIFTDGFQIETRTCTLRSLQIAVQQPVSVGGRFIELAARWKNETLLKSYTGDIVLNDAYQRILAMGPVVVPYIFAQLQSEGDRPQYWFWALERLTDADPVPKEDRGSAKKMRLHWLGWATENGYVA